MIVRLVMDLQIVAIAVVVVVVIIFLLMCLFTTKDSEFVPPLLLTESSQATKKSKSTSKKPHKEKPRVLSKEETDKKLKSEDLLQGDHLPQGSHTSTLPQGSHTSTKKYSKRNESKSSERGNAEDTVTHVKHETKAVKRHTSQKDTTDMELEEARLLAGDMEQHPQDPANYEKKRNKKTKKTSVSEGDKPQRKVVHKQSDELDMDLVIEQLRQTTLDANSLSVVVECMLLRQQYHQKMKQRDLDVAQLQTVAQEGDAEIKRLKNALKEADTKCRDLKRQLDVESNKTSALEATYRESINTYKYDNNKQLHTADHRVKQLTEQNAALQLRLQTMEKSHDTARYTQEIQRLQLEMNSQLQKGAHKEATLSTELNNVRKQVTTLEQKLHESDKARKFAEERSRQVEMVPKVDTSGLDKKLRDLEQENAAKNSKIQQIEEEWKRIMQDVKNVTAQASNYKNQLRQKDSELDELRAKMKQAQSKEQVMALKLTQSVGAQQNGHTHSEDTHEKEVEHLKEQVTHYVSSMKKLEEAMKEHALKEGTLLKNYEQAETKLTQVEIEKKDLEMGLEAMKKMLDSAPKVDVVEKQRKDLESSLNVRNNLESQVNELKKQLEVVGGDSKQVVVLRKQLDEFKNKCDNADTKLSEVSKDLQIEVAARKGAEQKAVLMEKELANATGGGVKDTVFRVEWPHNLFKANDVKLASDLWAWDQKQMSKGQTGWFIDLKPEKGSHQFKFVVDGLWRCCSLYPTARDDKGQENNTIDIHEGNTSEHSSLISSLQSQLSDRDTVINTLKQELKVFDKKLEDLQASKTGQVNAGIASAQWKDVESKNDLIHTLNKQLEEQRNKNHELREKNYRAVDAVEQMERNCKDLVASTQTKAAKEVSELRKCMETLLTKLSHKTKIQNVEKKSLLDLVGLIETLMEKEFVQTHTHTTTTVHADSDLVKENADLKKQLANYINVLAQVDAQLIKHEESYSRTNQLMQQRCVDLQIELARTKKDQSQDVDESLKSAEEVRSQLSRLQHKLESEEKDREVLREEIAILRKDLQTERATGRDLSAQAVKLRGMLKTGQDALKQEQTIVTELKAQISDLKNDVGTDGEKEKCNDLDLQMELEKLRGRLTDSEHKLETEKSQTKTLTAKLANLGVANTSH